MISIALICGPYAKKNQIENGKVRAEVDSNPLFLEFMDECFTKMVIVASDDYVHAN